MDKDNILELEDIWVGYGKSPVLKDLSLKIIRGEIVALLGANGAGKTTTLMSISGILKPKKGRIIFEGLDISKFSPKEIVALGIRQIPERKKVFRYLNVEENLLMGAYLEQDSLKIKENLDRVYSLFPPLWERKNKLADTLSGGEAQMLAIGMALMSEAKLLLLDEPSLGLAPKLVEETFKIIKEINRRGTSILLVEQNAMMALEIAQRGYVLEVGEVRFSGSSEEIKSNPIIKEAYLGG